MNPKTNQRIKLNNKVLYPAIIASTLFLQACVSTDSVSIKTKPADSWELTGKIGMMYPEANCIGDSCKMRSDQGGIKWQQNQQSYHIVLNDPFGRAVLQISGNDQQLKATAPGQQAITGTPEEFSRLLTKGKSQHSLLANLTPKDLSYWITGRPNPDYDTKQNKNNFEQKGYTIIASQWRSTPVGYMPSLVQLKKEQVKLRIVVKEWEKLAK